MRQDVRHGVQENVSWECAKNTAKTTTPIDMWLKSMFGSPSRSLGASDAFALEIYQNRPLTERLTQFASYMVDRNRRLSSISKCKAFRAGVLYQRYIKAEFVQDVCRQCNVFLLVEMLSNQRSTYVKLVAHTFLLIG